MKKLSLACILLALCGPASAWVGSPYIGPELVVQDLTTPTANFRGTMPRITAGYQAIFDCFTLGGEGYLAPFSLSIEDNHPTGQPGLKISSAYGFAVLPGLLITEDFIGYFRLGVTRSWFKDLSEYTTGWDAGIGLKAELSSSWSLRGEYVFTSYSNINPIGTPRSDEYSLGLIYKIDNSHRGF